MILEVGGKIRWLSASTETPETVREKDFRVHSNNHSINKLTLSTLRGSPLMSKIVWLLTE